MAFNGESDDPSSSTSGGDVQKMMRFRSADMLLLLQAAQLRDNFWTNEYFKVDLQEDYRAISEALAAQKRNVAVEKLAEILDTVTSGYRRAVSELTGTEAQGALRPQMAAPFFPGLRCSCMKCENLPWQKLQDVEDHQKDHSYSDNFHCRICYRRFYLQHSLTAHLIKKIGGGNPSGEELLQNESYNKWLQAQRSKELEELEQAVAKVEDILLPVPKNHRLDYEEETRHPIRERKRFMKTECPLCDQEYRFPFSHQLHFKSKHKRKKGDLETSFSCYNCNRSFLTRKFLRKHQKTVRRACHLRYRPFKCPKCRVRFHLASTRNSHVTQVHERKKLCLICQAPTSARCCNDHTAKECREAIKKHREKVRQLRGQDNKKQQAPKPMCVHCEEKFPNTFLLREHVNKQHLHQKNFTCEICGSTFYSQGMMQTHRKAEHLMLQVTRCETCNLNINAKANYLRHCRSKRHQDELLKLNMEKDKTEETKKNESISTTSHENNEIIQKSTEDTHSRTCLTRKVKVKIESFDTKKKQLNRKPKSKHSTTPCRYQKPEKVNFCNPCGTSIVGSMTRHHKSLKHKNNLIKYNEKKENRRFRRNLRMCNL